MERTREVLLRDAASVLEECAETTRRACEEMVRLIDEGRFGGLVAQTQFEWLYSLKNRRESILSTLHNLDGQRPDRAGMHRRKEADAIWRAGADSTSAT